MKVILHTCSGEKIEYDSQHGGFETWRAMPCLRCGTCCTKWQPPINEGEIETIARRLGISVDEFYRDYVQEYPVKPKSYLLRRQNNACIFLEYDSKQATCTIHPFRPADCRNWIPSLSRPECREGLRKRWQSASVILANEVFPSQKELAAFCHFLENYSIIEH